MHAQENAYAHANSRTLSHTCTHTHTYAHSHVSYEQIELQAKLLNYFLGSNKSNINRTPTDPKLQKGRLSGKIGYFSKEREFSINSGLQGISSISFLWKRTNCLEVIQK